MLLAATGGDGMDRLTGKVALIAGAASGLGEACAERFAAEGATVVGLDLKGAELEVDVRDEDAVAAAVDGVVDRHGRVDAVLNAAGVAGGGPVHQLDAGEWDRVLGVNLKGTFLVCKHALRHMKQQGEGSIVNFASVEGIEGTEGGSAYNASKGGVVLLTKNMAIDYGRFNIRVNCICPGFIDTPMFRSVMDSAGMAPFRDQYRKHHKLGRFGRPSEIAGAALFLVSDDASFVSGHALVVDGGFTAGWRTGLSDLMMGTTD
jgi:NAD(P)-dependent dehydrogenase (short-subunit alcohol dehydrogenase family)